ncbi:MAG: ribonuclease [Thermoleophilia bacterium]|nr:ribonuclease [Thermoleophilia bacterium]
MPLTCCQIVRKGRFVSALPWFENGASISLGDAKAHHGSVGKLALVQHTREFGRVTEVLGPIDSITAVMRGLLAEQGLLGDVPAPGEPIGTPTKAVQAQLDDLPREIPHLDTRLDCRGDLVVTIDPPTAKDHDDAIGLTRAAAGASHAWTVAVHIADVSAYVPTGSPIDEAAREKAMSAYVPGTVAPMLPFELSSDLCSLRPGVDRGCVSVFADLDAAGEVVDLRFARTVIRSARRLSYDEVDRVLAKRASIDPLIDGLLADIDAVTQLLADRRAKRGALVMSLPETVIELEGDRVTGAHLDFGSDSHRLVEECMLLANDAVGAYLAREEAPGMWRIHEHPEATAIEGLFRTFEELGVPMPPMPDLATMTGTEAAAIASKAAVAARRYAETSGRGRISFAPRVLRALQKADYRATSGPHSGLATEDYGHFTSPIRRYPDLVNHRSLLELLGLETGEPATENLKLVAQSVSETERELQKLERTANNIALAYLLHQRLFAGELLGDDGAGMFHGEVVGLIGAGMFVRFGDVFDGFVPARTLATNERYELDEAGLALVGQRSKHRYRLGDPLEVYVDNIDRARGRVELRRAGTSAGAHRREGASAGVDRARPKSSKPKPRRGGGGGGGGKKGKRPAKRPR